MFISFSINANSTFRNVYEISRTFDPLKCIQFIKQQITEIHTAHNEFDVRKKKKNCDCNDLHKSMNRMDCFLFFFFFSFITIYQTYIHMYIAIVPESCSKVQDKRDTKWKQNFEQIFFSKTWRYLNFERSSKQQGCFRIYSRL